MTREQQFFLEVLSDHLHQRETAVPEGLDWQQLAAYAKSHQVEALVGIQCRSFLKHQPELKDVFTRFDRANAAAAFFYANKLQAFRELDEACREEHIRFFAVKGLDVAALYPVPPCRSRYRHDHRGSGKGI